MAGQFFKRITTILKEEQVTFDPKVVAELVTKHFPDFRRVLNELQRYSVSGNIDSGILVNVSKESFKELIKNLKDKNFTEVRKWVSKNSDGEPSFIFRELYDTASENLDKSSIPPLVLILADYQYRTAFVVDHEINLMAALTEIMKECKFL
jgi:DNA polymerase III delta prime subunit